jgi:NAD(P)-dependent dehydrogenase (short-subunit alcohol dehydrogenase family)
MPNSSAVVLITGASGAIGSATTKQFLDSGFRVLGIDRRPSAFSTPDYRHLELDLQDESKLDDGINTNSDWGRLQHIISIAGGALPHEPVTQDDPAQLDVETFRDSLSLNLTSHFLLLRTALPWLRRSDGDRSVTFTSSFNALTGWGMPAYSAAKAGLIGMMNALTDPLGREGIRVNVVAPGTVRTPRTERIWSHDENHFPALERTTALGRLGTPEDIAQTFLALCTMMPHVTGQTLVVDGGQMVKRRL